MMRTVLTDSVFCWTNSTRLAAMMRQLRMSTMITMTLVMEMMFPRMIGVGSVAAAHEIWITLGKGRLWTEQA